MLKQTEHFVLIKLNVFYVRLNML